MSSKTGTWSVIKAYCIVTVKHGLGSLEIRLIRWKVAEVAVRRILRRRRSLASALIGQTTTARQ